MVDTLSSKSSKSSNTSLLNSHWSESKQLIWKKLHTLAEPYLAAPSTSLLNNTQPLSPPPTSATHSPKPSPKQSPKISELIQDTTRHQQLMFTVDPKGTSYSGDPKPQTSEKRASDNHPTEIRTPDNHTTEANNPKPTPLLLADLTKHQCDLPIWESLIELANASKLDKQIDAMMNGDAVNFTEKRAAWHTQLRSCLVNNPKASRSQQQMQRNINVTYDKMAQLTADIHKQQRFKQVIHIGIGGSDFGPRLAVEALREYHLAAETYSFHFVANIDPVELHRVLQQCIRSETLVIVCSKSFGTLETLTNAKTVFEWLGGPSAVQRQVIAITNNIDAAAKFGIKSTHILPMWDWVGGRYSLWSTIGLTLMIAIGPERFNELRRGGLAVDEHLQNSPLHRNLPVAMALIGIWYINFLKTSAHAVIPYDQTLERLPSYLQQLDMESNGKRVDRWNQPIPYATGPIIWGNIGCNSQHSFHQLFHQGTVNAPIDFLLPLQSTLKDPASRNNHRMLVANCLAQSEALVYGQDSDAAEASLLERGLSTTSAATMKEHLVVPGNRPHSIIAYPTSSPASLGALIALYEHKVFCQGAIWNINSFDQWGVELGKTLAKPIFNQLSPSLTEEKPQSATSTKQTVQSRGTSELIDAYRHLSTQKEAPAKSSLQKQPAVETAGYLK